MKSRLFKLATVYAALNLLFLVPSASAFVSSQDWQFATDNNPAEPTVFENSAGTPILELSITSVGAGWMADLIDFGTQTGLWDLGGQTSDNTNQTRGSVSIDIPIPAEPQSPFADVALKLVQFVDGTFYTGNLSFSLPDAVFAGRTTNEVVSGFLGGVWVEDSYNWRVPTVTNSISLVITGAKEGMLLDRVRVDANIVEPEPPKPIIASIEKKATNVVSITWSGGKPPYQLLHAASLSDQPADWQPVGSPVTGNSVEISTDEPGGFFRVSGGS